MIFGIVSIALFMASIDQTIVATGLPTLRHALHTQINWAAWTMTAYQLGLVVAMPVAGRISDQWGRKRVFVAAAVLFTSASLLCGLVNDIGVLIALRVLQAFGGAAFMPTASGMVVEAFGRSRNKALGMFSSIFPLGALVGPILGGILITDWSWRAIFLVNVPVGVLFTLLAIRFLPSSARRPGRTDVRGAVLLGLAVLGLMLAVTDLGDAGARVISLKFAVPLLFGIGAGWVFFWRSARIEHPLIPLHILRGKVFAAMNAINFVWGTCAIGFGALVPLFAQERYGLSPLASGTLLTARAIGEVALAFAASMLLDRVGYRPPMMVGFVFISTGFALIATHPHVLGPYGWMSFGAALTGIGTGLSAPASNNASIELSPDDVGAISGLRGASRQTGSILGVAIVTAIVARSSHEAVLLGRSFVVLGIMLTALIPLVLVVPNGRSRRVPVRR